jgi:membrane fusion protein (multidrug efflux system)
MPGNKALCVAAFGFVLFMTNHIVYAAPRLLGRTESPLAAVTTPSEIETERSSPPSLYSYKVEGGIIRAYRQATVAAEIQGVVEKRHYKEGELVKEGTVIFEFSKELFRIIADRSKERLGAFEAAREQAEEELKLKESLMSKDAATLQEIIRTRAEAKVASHRAKEAAIELELALRELRKCTVAVPFTGYIVAFYKDAYESVQRFDPLFLIADMSKVYAVVNVAQSLLSQTVKGTKAFFTTPAGASFEGVVEKVEAPIDPSSQTKKVYVIIDNSNGKLEMGMLGQVTFNPMSR